MLLRGVYTFDPRPEDHDHTLSFSCNDSLIFLEVLKHDTNWIKVVDILGRIGYVPKNFTVPDENFDDHNLILTFLVDAVVKARYNNLPSAPVLETLRDEIREYPSTAEKRARAMMNKVFRGETKSCDGPGPKARRSASDQTANKHTVREYVWSSQERPNLQRIGSDLDLRTNGKPTANTPKEPKAPPANQSDHQQQRNCAQTKHNYFSDSSVRTAIDDDCPENIRDDKNCLYECSFRSLQEIKSRLVNVVQETCNLGPKVSENLLVEAFRQVKESSSNLPMDSILDKLKAKTLPNSDPAINELGKVMKYLSMWSKDRIKERKSPSNRGRITQPINIDSDCLLEKLDKLRKLLIDCDPFKVVQILQADQHEFSQDLVHVYHLDSPVNLKVKLLDIFLIICTMDRSGRKVLLSTTLPLYLGRELMAGTGTGTTAKQIFKQQMDLLTSLLTCGDIMPETHFEILGTGFVNFLLQELENAYGNACGNWEYDKVSGDCISPLINLILAYNLQFEVANNKENIVLKVLAESRQRPKAFCTLLIHLFRKACCDPLRTEMQDDNWPMMTKSNCVNSVFKMVNEICLCQRTKAQLTANETQELITAIRDGLMDNPAGSVRLGYLYVLQALLDNFQGSLRDIRTALMSILLDNDPLAIPEQGLIRVISKGCPTLFVQSISRIRIDVHGDNQDDNNDHRQEDNLDNYSYLSS